MVKGLIKNKTALITGSSSGIGKEIAINLAKQNIKVCINYSKSLQQALSVKQEIEKSGGKAIIFKADVTKENEVIKMFKFLSKEYNSLDILINNAGIGFENKIENTKYKDWQRVINNNLNGKFLCTKHAIPLLKKSLNPKIINIASRIGSKPIELASAYCSAAAGIIMFSKVSALELARYNIIVNSISPGLVDTPLTEKMYANPQEYIKEYARL
jgi:NAD(P)-dependent dehydrogenase (short-subunit alcohol dehydrogenase family)